MRKKRTSSTSSSTNYSWRPTCSTTGNALEGGPTEAEASADRTPVLAAIVVRRMGAQVSCPNKA